jgi:hypothetical protein
MVQGRKSDDRLSKKPQQIRNRLRRGAAKSDADLEMLMQNDSRWRPVEDWDYEELAHGRPRTKLGDFRGITPKWITPHVAAEARRRLRERAFAELSGHIGAALEVMRAIMDDPNEDSRIRLDAAKFVVEQVLGKAKVSVDLESSNQVKTMLAAALILPSGEPAHPVIQGDYIVEEDEEDE